MGEYDDKVFLKRFSGIIAGLIIVAILLIVISMGSNRLETGANPSRGAFASERIAPVGAVRTQLPEPEATEPEAAVAFEAAEPEPVATVDGESIYNAACLACHMSGAAGAPIPGSEAWAERAAKGMDALVSSAISGLGVMPPKGGRADFTDDEIEAAVEFMLEQ